MVARTRTKTMQRIAAMALTLCAATGPANAAVFNFSWTGNPSEDATIVSSADATLGAYGTVQINALPGSSFSLADILSTSITVTGNSITPFTFTSWDSAAGSIAADGLSATFVGSGSNEPFFFSSPAFFGCLIDLCGQSEIRVRSGVTNSVIYTSASAALASLRMTAPTAAPEPGTLALLGLGLAGLGLSRRRKAH